MYEIYLKNVKTEKQFSICLSSPYLFREFLKKLKHSKNVKMVFYKTI